MHRIKSGLLKGLTTAMLICAVGSMSLPQAVLAETTQDEVMSDKGAVLASDDGDVTEAGTTSTEESETAQNPEVTGESVNESTEGEATPEATETPEETTDAAEIDESTEDSQEELVTEEEEDILETSGKWEENAKGVRYYTSSKEYLKDGFHKVDGHYYYFNESGYVQVGWLKVDGYVYYMRTSGNDGNYGKMLTGWQIISGKNFYFRTSTSHYGAAYMGMHTIKGKVYYFDKSGDLGTKGQVTTGWKTINGKIYRFQKTGDLGEKGQAFSGWKKLNKKYYYFTPSGSDKGVMKTGWQTIDESKYYLKTKGDYEVKGARFTGLHSISGTKYFFNSKGQYINPHNRTIKGMMLNGMMPMGYTLYIWGGGHDNADATRAGVNPNWKAFFKTQGSGYNYNNYRFKYGAGLDCSGFVGWTTYNTLHKTSGKKSVTNTSGDYGSSYSRRGWGTVQNGISSPSFRCGDIVGYNGHVWIILGKASDGSYVIMHSSPAGVKLAGTVTTSGNSNSKAVQLAKRYMKKYFSSYYNKLTNDGYVAGSGYLSGSKLYRFRWTIGGVMKDPDGYVNMSAEQILKDIFCE